MKILSEGLASYPQCPSRYLGFEKFQNLADNFLLVVGSAYKPQVLKNYSMKKVLIEFDEPNRYYYPPEITRHDSYENSFDKIFTICPYSAEWLNKKNDCKKREFVFFPFNQELIPNNREKIYDVIYTGHILSRTIENLINQITEFNYVLVSNSEDPRVNFKSVSYLEKLNLISNSKITLIHNLHFMDSYHISNLHTISDFKLNKAFQKVPSINYKNILFNRLINTSKRFLNRKLKKYDAIEIEVPHIKSRTFEAAFCKSLMLVQKDDFNIIEEFFEPEKEFIYFKKGELNIKITEILKNYSKFNEVIEAAYNRAINNYTTEIFFNKYLKDLHV